MLPARQLRGLLQGVRAPVRRATVFGAYRFNSTIATNVNGATASQPAAQNEAQPPKEAAPNTDKPRYHINSKLREIKKQTQETIEGSSDLAECKEIFEEALTYLRQIEHTENIPSKDIYFQFQQSSFLLLSKMIDSDATPEELASFLDKLIEFKVVHIANFMQVMKNNITTGNYAANFHVWVQALETLQQPEMKNLMFWKFKFYTDLFPFLGTNVLSDLVYFSYYQAAQAGQVQYRQQDVLALLNIKQLRRDDWVASSLKEIGITEGVAEFRQFVFQHAKEQLTQNPNTPEFWKHLDVLTERKSSRQVVGLYQEFIAKKTHLSMDTIYRFMSSFYALRNFNMVYQIFGQITSHQVKPTEPIWGLILRTIAHSETVKDYTDEQKKATSAQIDQLVETMKQQGLKFNAKTVSTIISAYANLNNFNRVDQYFDEYDGKVPIIDSTKNNYLSGLILNGYVKEAEQKFLEYMRKDDTYKPSVMVMNNMLNHYAKTQNMEAVKGIIAFMNKNAIAEDIATVTILTDLFFKVSLEKGVTPDFDSVVSLFATNNIKYDEPTMSVLIDGLVKSHNIVGARVLFKNYINSNKKLSPEILTTMLKGELNSGAVETAEHIFNTQLLKVANTTRVWNMMINSLLGKDENLAVKYYVRMKAEPSKSSQPNFYTYYFLLSHFDRRNKKEVVQKILDDLDAAKLSDLGSEIPKLLRSLGSKYNISAGLRSQI